MIELLKINLKESREKESEGTSTQYDIIKDLQVGCVSNLSKKTIRVSVCFISSLQFEVQKIFDS